MQQFVIRSMMTSGAAAVLLAGCAPLPPLRTDIPATPEAFRNAAATPPAPAGAAFAGPWWAIFGDPVLDDLIARAEARNDSIAIAVADLDRARAVAGIVRADQSPQLGGGAAVTRGDGIGGQPVAIQPGPNSLGRFGVDLSYEVDLFGRLRQSTRAAELDARSTAGLLMDARLLVQAEVATTYFALRAVDDEAAILGDTIESYRRSVEVTRALVREGERSRLDQDRAEGQLADAEGEQQVLRRRRAALANALAVLVGEAASTFELPPQSPLAGPPVIPAGLPSAMLARRPDVRAASEAMYAAQARVGAAQAQWFPTLSLTASGGRASSDLGALLESGAGLWSVGALVLAPILDGGRRSQNVARTRAELDRSFAEYRRTLLTAFRDVEDQLSAIDALHAEAEDRTRSTGAFTRAADVANARYRDGEVSQLELLDAQRAALLAQRQLCQVTGAQNQATALLIRALGGSWDMAVS